MLVSVIIPVYNAAPFLKQAVLSATSLPEVREVILVEDHSQDNSLIVCKELSSQPKVLLLTHTSNRGASVARNTGLAAISNESKYVAFLDADDFYLENRFTSCLRFLENNPNVDGTFGSADHHFYNENSKNQYVALHDLFKGQMGIFHETSSAVLFEQLVRNQIGYFHLNTLTLRKTSLKKIGPFDPDLRQCQDTDFIWKASLVSTLENQSGSAIATIGVHKGNRIQNREESEHSRALLFKKWIKNTNPKITKQCRIHLIRSYLTSKEILRNRNKSTSLTLLHKSIDFLKLTYSSPHIIKSFF